LIKKKCINNSKFSDNNCQINRTATSISMPGLYFSLGGQDNNDEKTVWIQIRYSEMFPDKYGEEEIKNGSTNDDIYLNFNKKVEAIFGGTFGPDFTQNMIYLFLLEDGTLEYMKSADIYNSKKYEHYPVSEVNDIVKFDNVTLNYGNSTDWHSIYTIIAYKIDGTYYDLSKLI